MQAQNPTTSGRSMSFRTSYLKHNWGDSQLSNSGKPIRLSGLLLLRDYKRAVVLKPQTHKRVTIDLETEALNPKVPRLRHLKRKPYTDTLRP